jgi:ubiquinone/menaquinone biosynthesis C-methylase UbiE
MSKDINKTNLEVNKELANIQAHFNTKKLEPYNFENIYNSIEDNKIGKIINGVTSLISSGPVGSSKNYRLEYYEFYVKFIITILTTHPRKYTINKFYLKLNFLEILTRLMKGNEYLKKIEAFIIDNFKDLNTISMLTFAASKGNILSFLFWKKFLKTDLLVDENSCIFEGSIKNSDDRIFKWFINHMKETNKNTYFQKSSVIVNLLNTILTSNIPDKYKLKRIKILSQNCNLIPYFNEMVESTASVGVLYQLMKYYYKVPMETVQIKELSTCINNDDDKTKIKEVFDMLKTSKEKTMLNIFNIFSNYCSIIDTTDITIDYNNIEESIGIIFEDLNRSLLYIPESVGICKSLSDLIEKTNCPCGKRCFGNLIKYFGKINLFHHLTNSNFFNKMKDNISPFIQVLTKFYSPIIINNPYDSNKNSLLLLKNKLAINKVLSFLRICAKKKSKVKIINFKSKYLPLMEELLNFKPKNLPVLKNGSKNWQYQKQKFTNLPPRHLLPHEITTYNDFLLREKADGILLNNLPLSISPKLEEIFIRQVKAEYIEDLELYLVFDIDLPNTHILNRYEYLRSIHPYTKNTSIKKVNTINDFINEITEERLLFERFLEETKSEKNRWYPKSSYLVEKATNNFKKELILDMIENNNSKLTKYINQEGPFNCDGIILSPLTGTCMRDIKIKPKELMTIDLLYDGSNWIDKDKNKTSVKIHLNDFKPKINKIYRCYPIDKLGETFEPREIRFDKKYPNSFDIINQILTIYKFDWTKEISSERPYYQVIKPNLNQNYLKELNLQTDILQQQITKMNPDNGKTWLDLGCGKGKLINYIRKYNPKKYVGLDVDENILLNNIHMMDEHDWIKFNPCNLRDDWFENIKWYSIQNMKFDYIIMNFSIMHLFDSEKFWIQLKSVCKPTTKIFFNVVSKNIIEKPYKYIDAYMKYDDKKIIYCFPWSQTNEISENFITKEEIEDKVRTYSFLIEDIFNSNTDSLISKYDWYHLCLK